MRIGIKVRFWRNSFAPGSIQAKAVSSRVTKLIQETAEKNGRPKQEEQGVLMSPEDLEAGFLSLSKKHLKAVEEGFIIIAIVDPWEFAHAYGYDAHTAFERQP